MTPDGSTLTLLRLSPEDSGTYTCLAVSPAGQESKIYTLFVLGQLECLICASCVRAQLSEWFALISIRPVAVPPSISGETTVPREVQVTQDSAVTLECQAAGNPSPQISWLKNGHPLLLSPRARLLSGDSVLRSGRMQSCLFCENMFIGEVELNVPFLHEKGSLLCSCQTLEFTHVWHAVELDSLSLAMMSKFKVQT